jgi:Lar family restriction alleviation protein
MRLDKSCPFCGSTKDPASRAMHTNRGMRYVVVCHNCGARGPGHETLQGAIDAWTVRYSNILDKLQDSPQGQEGSDE